MQLKLEQEIWMSKFAERLVELQPQFPLTLARRIAMDFWPHLGIVTPMDAVMTILDWAMDVHQQDEGQPPAS